MKKLFPIAITAVLSVILYSSCEKKTQENPTRYCYCYYTDKTGNDSAFGNFSGYSSQYSYERAKQQCKKFEDTLRTTTKPGITCTID